MDHFRKQASQVSNTSYNSFKQNSAPMDSSSQVPPSSNVQDASLAPSLQQSIDGIGEGHLGTNDARDSTQMPDEIHDYAESNKKSKVVGKKAISPDKKKREVKK